MEPFKEGLWQTQPSLQTKCLTRQAIEWHCELNFSLGLPHEVGNSDHHMKADQGHLQTDSGYLPVSVSVWARCPFNFSDVSPDSRRFSHGGVGKDQTPLSRAIPKNIRCRQDRACPSLTCRISSGTVLIRTSLVKMARLISGCLLGIRHFVRSAEIPSTAFSDYRRKRGYHVWCPEREARCLTVRSQG